MDHQQFLVMFPGQGSQKPGMSKDLVERYPRAAEVWERVDRALGFKLSDLAFNGSAEELTLTHNAQPALLAHSAAAWTVLTEHVAPSAFIAAAGHSLGEFSAYVATGMFSIEDGARLVRRRGELMLSAGIERPGTMAAILGETQLPIEAICAHAGELGVVVPANYNSPEQVVISGEIVAVEDAMARAKASGAKRAVRLNVSGAFHSPLLDDAANEFRTTLRAVVKHRFTMPVYSNVTAEAVRLPETAALLLVDQLTSPVRWVRLMETMCKDYPRIPVLEVGTGNVLCGLVKRIVPEAECIPVGTVADVEKFMARFVNADPSSSTPQS
jgi:[acyl-carrier-protein] S-malonyltransferase